jgi:ATP-binding cassette subfamily B protein
MSLGELFSRFDGDLAEVQRFVVDSPLALIGGLFNLTALTLLMCSLSTPLALLVLAIIPLQVAAAWVKRRDIENAARQVRVRSAALSSYFLDSLRAVKFIQATNTQSARMEGLRDHHREYYLSLRASQQAGFVLSVLQRLAGTLGMAIVVGAAGWLLMHHKTSVGVLVAFVGYAARAGGPVNTLLGVFSGWQRARVSLSRVAELLQSPPLRDALATTRAMPGICRGEIEFRAVSYRHDSDVCVLRDASFRAAAGSKTVLLGISGGGKSTVADLMLCHYMPQAGAILLDGVDISYVDLAQLRQRVSVVDQEPVFFPGTVADNLRYVRPEAGDAEIRAAMTQAGLDLARVAPERNLGASSYALSRGERMRLALARAILQNPAVLILDETTSAVDRVLALSIMGCVDRIFAGKTRIVITHDPLLAGEVDQVCVLRSGQVTTKSAEVAHAA